MRAATYREFREPLAIERVSDPTPPDDGVIIAVKAHRYPAMLEMIRTGRLNPGSLVGRRIGLEAAVRALPAMDRDASVGVTIVNSF